MPLLSLPSEEEPVQPPTSDGQSTLLGLTWTRKQPASLYQANARRRCVRCARVLPVGTMHTQDTRGGAVCLRCEPTYGRPPHARGGDCQSGHRIVWWGDSRRTRCVRCGEVWTAGMPAEDDHAENVEDEMRQPGA